MQAPAQLSLTSTRPDCRENRGESGHLEETNGRSTEAPCLLRLIVEMKQHVPVQRVEGSRAAFPHGRHLEADQWKAE